MSFLSFRKSPRLLAASLVVLLSWQAFALADDGGAPGGGSAPVTVLGHEFCCPVFWHCYPKGPKIKYKCVCPKPICDPCNLEHYGYYPVCWRPWMEQVDWSHCPVPPPAVLAPAFNPPTVQAPATEQDLQLPMPNKLTPTPGPGPSIRDR